MMKTGGTGVKYTETREGGEKRIKKIKPKYDKCEKFCNKPNYIT